MNTVKGVKHRRRAGFLLAALGRRAERSWSGQLTDMHMTTAQFTAMSVIVDEEITQRDLALQAGVDARNMSATVKSLIDSGLVESRVSDSDGRARLLSATESGQMRWSSIQAELATKRAEFFTGLNDEEVEALESLLNKLNDHHASCES